MTNSKAGRPTPEEIGQGNGNHHENGCLDNQNVTQKEAQGKFLLGGSLLVQDPKFEDMETDFFQEKECMEFTLRQIRNQSQKLKFSFWLNLEFADCKISTGYKDDEGRLLYPGITLLFQDSIGRELSLTLNLKQASVVKNILERFLESWYSYQILKGEQVVKVNFKQE